MNDRDTFAAAALTGLLAQGDDGSFSEESYARAAYRWADAMLAFRDSRIANETNHDAAPAAKAAKETLARATDADGTGNTQEPVAWAVLAKDVGATAAICSTLMEAERLAARSVDWRKEIVPLYRHPQPPLCDPEIAVESLKARLAELEHAFYLIARADATLSVCDGNVTVTVDTTLTDEERDAVKLAADFLEDEFYGCSDKCAAEHNAVATLRNLLERLK